MFDRLRWMKISLQPLYAVHRVIPRLLANPDTCGLTFGRHRRLSVLVVEVARVEGRSCDERLPRSTSLGSAVLRSRLRYMALLSAIPLPAFTSSLGS